jgi:hypothetical protein
MVYWLVQATTVLNIVVYMGASSTNQICFIIYGVHAVDIPSDVTIGAYRYTFFYNLIYFFV